MADAMASDGRKEAGYEDVVIDDCWQVSRDEKRKYRPRSRALPFRHQGSCGLPAFGCDGENYAVEFALR
jgi:hypothetical protein